MLNIVTFCDTIVNMKDENQLLSINEAAEMLNVHANTLRNWDKSGELPAIHVGPRRQRRYRKADLEAYLRNTA